MKHAFLIIAHDRPNELSRLIQALDDDRNDIYVHIDKKAHADFSVLEGIAEHSRLFFIPRMHVTWGGSSQVDVELALFSQAFKNGPYAYYHLLSGVDYPVKSNDYIHEYCEQYKGLNFIQIEHELPRQRMRYEQYHLLQNTLVGKKRNIFKYIDFGQCTLQSLVGIHRHTGPTLQRYINWVSITQQAVTDLVEHANEIHKRYRWTYCCDEIFLLESIHDPCFRDTIAPQGNLRYIEWVDFSKHDSSPRVLTIDDLPTLEKPDYLFARKFNLPQSESLYDALNARNSPKQPKDFSDEQK
ncbi:beta-1,6-N-acetylglucosaminyltransferase [Bifidobacterium sp. AGR2158]|uniref:beta-1,6-N-acetylglucosaminyltransferase n=1 Tax=Bifidobacterium sp. AGR2158 TaxID=1280675 RepID=UPI000684F6C3|nr:beta-1,6-N-acetylglucosaminyltransferase [Bifidobacterium sp. AGR2158]